ncbi:phosphotransferase family protein [Aestuariimicrobium soli]|uniref:phosphotransferase family protein n=1 Tax=Aestuariimicrobium soli TaxID=2035834 RepID=UPI003EC13D95
MDPESTLTLIARRHDLTGAFSRLTEGQTNHVFTNGREVVRFARDPLRGTVSDVGEFEREAWCARAAAAVGVPTVEVLVVDELPADDLESGRVPYQVQRFVEGTHPTSETPALWERLGEYAASLATVSLRDAPDGLFSRFGRDLPLAWQRHVEYNLASLGDRGDGGDGDRLLALGVYEPDDLDWLVERTNACRAPGGRFGLHHGDLNPGNVLVRPDGELVLIDWGSAAAGPVPWGDLVHLHRMEHLSGDRLQQAATFAAAFGVTADEVHASLGDLDLLQAMDLVRWALDRRPDLLADHVEQARAVVRRRSRGERR